MAEFQGIVQDAIKEVQEILNGVEEQLQDRGMSQREINDIFSKAKLTTEGLAQFALDFGEPELVQQMLNDVAAERRGQ